MPLPILSRAPLETVAGATASGLGVLVMTTIHHVYGAAIFSTPWRLHIVYISIPVALVILGAVPLGIRRYSSFSGHGASWLFILLIAVFAVALIGVYEGGYNHLLPNIQYVLGVERTLRDGLYVPPDDLLFQLTGIAQFVVAVVAAWFLVCLMRQAQQSQPAMITGSA
jgi:hypothetical protein